MEVGKRTPALGRLYRSCAVERLAKSGRCDTRRSMAVTQEA